MVKCICFRWHLKWFEIILKYWFLKHFSGLKSLQWYRVVGRLFCFTVCLQFMGHLTSNSISNNSVDITIFFVYKEWNFKTHHLNVKTVQFQTNHFSISNQFSSILSIDRTLSGTTTPCLSWPGSYEMKDNSKFPKAPASLEPHHHIDLHIIQDTNWGVLLISTGFGMKNDKKYETTN